ncbi:LRC72 protein, partial [Crypturellus undulatus]|nr:LRC72 protein [Crypturellus undulatus]
GLRSIPSLARFHRLRYLWINNNKIQDLSFLVKNHCLTELYLNNNEITDISGALKHLCVLQILLLHNNQLKHLGRTVEELKGMRSLQTLSVFHNPLAQEPGYRLYMIYFLPSVQLLDRKPVTPRERESALHIYDGERSRVVQALAFGKRLGTPLAVSSARRRAARPAAALALPAGIYNPSAGVPFENPVDAVFLRAMTRSIMEFSCVDWNKVSTCQERRLENKAEEPYEMLTVKFR